MSFYWIIGITGILVTLLLSALAFAYRFGIWKGGVDADRSALKDKAHKFGTWKEEIDTDRSALKKSVGRLEQTVDEIRSDIKNILNRLPPHPTAENSPIGLTDMGERISGEIRAEEWVEAEWAALLPQTEGQDAFGIQGIAFDYAQSFEPGAELLTRMRASAFDNSIDLQGVRKVLGVVLRDRLLKHHGLRSSRNGE